MRYSIVKQNRFRILICEGFRYSRYMAVYNKEYWRCTDRSCKGKLHLCSGRIVYIKKDGHNHKPDHKGISAEQALLAMRKRACNEETPFKQIYYETMREFEENGHGSLRESLPYATVTWKVLDMPGPMKKQLVNSSGTSSKPLHHSEVTDVLNGNSDVEVLMDGSSSVAQNGDGMSSQAENEQKPDVEVIDCTVVTVESTQPSAASSSVVLTTRPPSEMLPASHSTPAGSGRVLYNHSSVYSDRRSPATTITTQGGVQRGIDTPSLKIHSAYSLQNASTIDDLQGTVSNADMNMHSTGNMLATLQRSGHETVNETQVSYATQPSSSTLQVTSEDSQVLGTQHTELNGHSPVQSYRMASRSVMSNTGNRLVGRKGGVVKRSGPGIPAARILSRSTPLARPNTVHSFVEPAAPPQGSPGSQEQAYCQLKMRLAKKEHQLRLQHMKERHEADMVLVHLQQELVREQLRELRQPRGGVNT